MSVPSEIENPLVRALQVVTAPNEVAGHEIGLTGPERRAANVAALWRGLGVDVAVAYPRRGRLWDSFVSSGVSVTPYEIGGKWDRRAIDRIASIAASHRAQVIHSQGPPSVDLFTVLAARRLGIGSVITRPVMISDNVHRAHWRRLAYQALDRAITLPKADAIVAVSRDGFDRLKSLSAVRQGHLHLILNGVDISKFSARQSEPGREPLVLGMVGHLLPYKGWADFLRVIARLRADGINIRGLVVGEGAQRSELEALARTLGVSDVVTFAGYQADIAPVLQRMDLLLFTSLREGLSVAIIEAMASGLPIVATRVGGIAEQVEPGANGFIEAAGDVGALAARCRTVLANPNLMASMGATSRRFAETRFSQEAMLNKYASLYRITARAGSDFS